MDGPQESYALPKDATDEPAAKSMETGTITIQLET